VGNADQGRRLVDALDAGLEWWALGLVEVTLGNGGIAASERAVTGNQAEA
jgi:hypothetical protein